MTTLALFDFDHTLTKRDSLIDVLIFTFGIKKFVFIISINFFSLAFYKLGLKSNSETKEKLISSYFKEYSYPLFNHQMKKYSLERVPEILNPKALEKLRWHKKKNHRVIVVSASIFEWVNPWCKSENIECISTKLVVKNQKIIGKFDGKNCYGPEKVQRILDLINIKNYKEIYVYGDSKGDKEMFSLATRKFFKCF